MRSLTIAPDSPLHTKRCLGISGPIDLAICQPSGRQEHLRGCQASGTVFLAPRPSGRHIAATGSKANAGSIAPWRAGVVSASGLGGHGGSVPAADAAGRGCVGLRPKQPSLVVAASGLSSRTRVWRPLALGRQPSGRHKNCRGRQASGAFFFAPKPSGRHIAAARSKANAGSIAPWRAGVVSASGLGGHGGSVPAADAAGRGCVGLWPKQPRDLGDAAKSTPTVVVETAARRDRDPSPRID